jgi:nucleoside-diphosphate-sugar epimerase
MKILLTGATGFIGVHLYSLLPNSIKCVVRKHKVIPSNNIFKINSLDKNTDWQGAFDDIESIIHLAGLAHSHNFTDEDYQSVNVDGTLKLANEAAKAGVKRFVFVSSIGVNGNLTNHIPFSDSSDPAPYNAYASSKYNTEIGLKKIASETGLELVIIRPTLVYGHNAPGNFGSLTKLVQKSPFLPFGLTDNKRDFISVQNLADLLMVCANHPNAAGRTFLASDYETISIKAFTNAIAKGLNKTLIQLPIPIGFMRLAARLVGKSAMAAQLLDNLQVDSSNAQVVLGWTPPYTMEQAMASLLESKK